MSTQIHNGFRFPQGFQSLAQLQTWVQHTQNLLQPLADRQHQKALVDEAWRLFDRDLLGAAGLILPDPWPLVPPSPTSSYRSAAWEVRRARLGGKETPSSEKAEPPTLSVSLAQDEQGRLYGLLNSKDPVLTQAFRAHAGVEEYGYWDNTDRPEHLDEAEWAARMDTWNSLVDPQGQLRSFGRSEIVPDDEVVPTLDPDNLCILMNPVEQRVEAWTNLAMARQLEDEFAAHNFTGSYKLGLGAFARRYCDMVEDPNHPWCLELQPQVRAALDTPVCVADLTTRDAGHRQRLTAGAQARVLALKVNAEPGRSSPLSKPRM